MPSKPLPGRMLGGAETPFDDPGFREAYPELTGYLSDTVYTDGKPRVTSTLLVFIDAGALKLCLNDRDNNRSAFVSRSTLSEGLAAMEAGLSKDTIEWRTRGDYTKQTSRTPY